MSATRASNNRQSAMTLMHTPQIKVQLLEAIAPYACNPKQHDEEQIGKLVASLREFGWTFPVLTDETGEIIAGHCRLLAAQRILKNGWTIHDWPDIKTAPVLEKHGLTESQKRAYRILDNRVAEDSEWNDELLSLELAKLADMDFDQVLTGFSAEEIEAITKGIAAETESEKRESGGRALADRFMVAPFSILDARRGWWAERKKAWLDIGLSSETGRDNLLAFSASSQPPSVYQAKNEYEARIGHKVTWKEFLTANPDLNIQSGTSIFDPVLCELAYRWFCPPGGLVIDPFAGGSVRGIVAAKTGRQYIGCDIRQEQVEANRNQWAEIGNDEPAPVWHCGDSKAIHQHCAGVEADFLFSCPPYADLEVYSDNPADISTMRYPEFIAAYREIIARSVSLLKNDRFACFVVGDVRDRNGLYRAFVPDTITAFRDAGMNLYNDAILITQAGSLAIRVGKQFSTSRKLGKTHQNVLVFVKGNPRAATEACGDVEIDDDLFVEKLD
ncbi:MAG: site-specific DNA-methyltransferase [Betaproteobacteria bacterium]|nr:site-specific DNA-methyltransferase [Betaproteobacteria bacterium]